MYGKLFESMYDGTLVEDWRGVITFQQMIVLCDADGTLDMTPGAISKRTSIPVEHIKAGIEILENPDPHSRTRAEDGCRIRRLDDHRPWGWYIVNHEKYKMLASAEERREQNRVNKQAQRERQRESSTVSNGQQLSAMSAHTDTNKQTNKEKTKTPTVVSRPSESTEFDDFKNRYPARAGAQPWKKAERAINARLKTGSSWHDILEGAKRYADYCAATERTGTEFVMQAATFCGPELHFRQTWKLSPTKSEHRQNKNVTAGVRWLDANAD